MMSKLVVALALGSAAAASSAGTEDDKKGLAHLRGLKLGHHTVPAPPCAATFCSLTAVERQPIGFFYQLCTPCNGGSTPYSSTCQAPELCKEFRFYDIGTTEGVAAAVNAGWTPITSVSALNDLKSEFLEVYNAQNGLKQIDDGILNADYNRCGIHFFEVGSGPGISNLLDLSGGVVNPALVYLGDSCATSYDAETVYSFKDYQSDNIYTSISETVEFNHGHSEPLYIDTRAPGIYYKDGPCQEE